MEKCDLAQLEEQIHYKFDLRYNYQALHLAVIAPFFITIEQSLSSIGFTKDKKIFTPTKNKYTQQDIEDMVKLREQGLTWKELSEIYGINKQTLHSAVKRWKETRLCAEQQK